MEIKTTMSGTVETIEADEQAVYTFEQGLYGLEDHRRYVLLKPDPELPFAYLQALDNERVCLLLTTPFVFFPTFEFDLPEADLMALGHPTMETVEVWVTVSVRGETIETATTNLLAPIVLNLKERLGRQVVLHDSPYQTKVPLFAEKEAK